MGRLCDADPYARSGTVVVKSCEQRGEGQWAVRVEDDSTTPFYPEGGGQPADRGMLDGKTVMDVRLEDGAVVHILDAPLDVGSSARAELDWARRWDHMQCHTGQHALSACAQRDLGAATVSWELLSETVAVTLEVASLAADAVDTLEKAVNEEIRSNRAVRVRDLSYEEAVASAQEKIFRGKLPEDGVHERIRLVEIVGLDLNACGGTHVRSLAELQLIKVVKVEKDRGRVCAHFVAGERALGRLGAALAREASLVAALSCTAEEIQPRVEAMQSDRAADAKERKRLLAELAAVDGKALATTARAGGVHLQHRSGVDVAYLNSVMSSYAAAGGVADALLLLTCDDGSQSAVAGGKSGKKGSANVKPSGPIPGGFLLAGPPQSVSAVSAAVAEMVGGQGGGRPGRFQGKGSDVSKTAELEELLSSLTVAPAN